MPTPTSNKPSPTAEEAALNEPIDPRAREQAMDARSDRARAERDANNQAARMQAPPDERPTHEEVRAIRQERDRQAAQIRDLQRQVGQRDRAPSPADVGERPSWVRDEHSDALVAALRSHGDAPRSVGITLAEGVELVLGIRNVYLCDAEGRIAAIPVQWSEPPPRA